MGTVLNGRMSDNETEMLTCKVSSILDQFLCSSNICNSIQKILDFCPLLSDAHNPINLTFNFEIPKGIERNTNDGTIVKLWDNTKINGDLNNTDLNQ